MDKKRGRPKGSKNHIDQRLRSTISRVFEENFTQKEIQRLIGKIEQEENGAKKAFDCYVALADFVLPKLQRVEHTGKDGDALSIEHVLNTLDAPEHHKARLPEPGSSDIIDVTPGKQLETD